MIHEPLLTVGILSGEEIRFALDGDFRTRPGGQTVHGKFVARLHGSSFVVEGEGYRSGELSEFVLEPQNESASSFVLFNVTIGVQFHWERRENQRFAGSLKLLCSGQRITAINIVPLEQYLASVISSEMSGKSPLHFLKAHAITSRSWLLAQLEKMRRVRDGGKRYQSVFEDDRERICWYDREDHELYEVCADDHCQRYQGISDAYAPAILQAVLETRGMILQYDNEVCDARFSKSCGGISELFENVWEDVHYPYLSSVVDGPTPPPGYALDGTDEQNAIEWIRGNPPAFCNSADKRILSQVLVRYDQETADFFRWNVTYTQDEMSSLILTKTGMDFGQIIDLVPLHRGASTRITNLKVVGTNHEFIFGKELEIRRILSPSHLRSSAFVVDALDVRHGIPGKFEISGAGWGHGVGLCQIGAAVMGTLGYTFDRILLHYFRGAEIHKLY